MLRNCRGPQRQRLLSKFTENDHEKVDRLLELHFKYLEKVEEVDLEIDHDRRVSYTCLLTESRVYVYIHHSLDCFTKVVEPGVPYVILILDSCCKQKVWFTHSIRIITRYCQEGRGLLMVTGEEQTEPLWELGLFVRVRDTQVYCIAGFKLLQMSFFRI